MGDHLISANDVALHGLIVSDEVETVTFESNVGNIDIITDGRAAVYFTINGSEPSVGSPNTYVLPAGAMAIDTRPTLNEPGSSDVVRLIADGEATVSIQVAG